MIEFGLEGEKRLTVHIAYAPQNIFNALVTVIRGYPDRRWNPDTMAWSFDLHIYDTLVTELSKVENSVSFTPALSAYMNAIEEKRSLLKGLAAYSEDDLAIDGWTVKPYRFQNAGIRFLSEGKRVMLADNMGLGKTIQAVGALLRLKQQGKIASALISGPDSVLDEWKFMIHHYTDYGCRYIGDSREYTHNQLFNTVSYETLTANLGYRKGAKRKDPQDGTSYEEIQALAVRDAERKSARKAMARECLREVCKYDVLVLDEAHRASHYQTQRFKAMFFLSKRISYLWALSATPLQNRLDELFTLFKLIDPDILGTKATFTSQYCLMGGWNDSEIVSHKNLDQFVDIISPYVLRRTRADVAQYLPPKTEVRRWVELTKEQRRMYEAIKNKMIAIDADPSKEAKIKRAETLAEISYLRQACLSTHLINPEIVSSAKLDLLQEVVENVVRDGSKMIIYCFYKPMCALIRERLGKYGIVYYDGDSTETTQEVKDRFTNSLDSIFLMTKVGGEGLNLEAANYFIFFNPEYNPKVMEQLWGRIDRLTQRKPIEIIHLLTKDTYEERIIQIVDGKNMLFDSTIGQISALDMSEEDLIRKCA